MKRIFVAISISEKFQQEILEWSRFFSRRMSMKNRGSSMAKPSGEKIRWLQGKNLHITLIPPWYEENIEEVKNKLETIREKFGVFEITFERVTYGPDPRRPRLIWAEGEAPEALVIVKNELFRILGQKEEVRPFKLHLTLARFRPETFSSFPLKKLDEKVFWHDEVKSFVLMESHLSPEGADYEVIEEITL